MVITKGEHLFLILNHRAQPHAATSRP